MRKRVEEAQEFRRLRLAWPPGGKASGSNACVHPRSLEILCGLQEPARAMLAEALDKESLGGRGYARAILVARTIADLDGAAGIGLDHMAEALSLRFVAYLRGAA